MLPMSASPSSDHRPAPHRYFLLGSKTLAWAAVFMLAALATGAAIYVTRHVPVPVWLRMLLLFIPPVLALVAIVMCLFSFGQEWIKRVSQEAAENIRPPRRGGLFLDALQLGSQTWSIGFVLVSFVAGMLTGISGLPVWLLVAIALSPLVPLVMYLRSISRDTAEVDELALHIRREAYGFVFISMIGIFVCVVLLEQAGVVSGFSWSSRHLVGMMLALLVTGAAISSRRFR